MGHRLRPNLLRKQTLPSHQLPSRSSPLTSRNTCDPSRRKRHNDVTHPPPRQNQNHHGPIYTHFSQPIRLSAKVPPSRRFSDTVARTSPEIRSELRPFIVHYGLGSPEGEALSVVGRPCQTLAPVVASLPPKRTHLHVFLPTGDQAREGEEADSESVDEGFMDELDSKITALRLQHGGSNAVPYH